MLVHINTSCVVYVGPYRLLPLACVFYFVYTCYYVVGGVNGLLPVYTHPGACAYTFSRLVIVPHVPTCSYSFFTAALPQRQHHYNITPTITRRIRGETVVNHHFHLFIRKLKKQNRVMYVPLWSTFYIFVQSGVTKLNVPS